MSTIVTRYGKGSPLTWLEVDNNFTNLNTDKIQSGNTVAALTITSATINGGTITGITDLAVADGGTGLSSLTAGYIPFGAGTSAFGSSANLFWDSANNRLGIGTSAPTTKLTISNNTALPSAGAINGTNLWQVGADALNNIVLLDSFANGPFVIGRRAQGTATSPTSVTNGLSLLTLQARGYGSTGYSTGKAQITLLASETWSDTAQGTYIRFDTTTNGTTTNTERMRIDDAGNVGIGTSSPGTYGKLAISGTTYILDGSYGLSLPANSVGGVGVELRGDANASSRHWQIKSNTSAYGLLDFQVSSTNASSGYASKMVIDSSGNVGIGTSSPVSLSGYTALQINNTTNGGLLEITNSTKTYWSYVNSGGGFIGMSSNDPLIIQTNNTERMRIDSSGNVGIGTSSPSTKLAVAGTFRVDGARSSFYANSEPYAIQLNYSTASSNGPYIGSPSADTFVVSNSGGAERMRIDSSGNVGIGTTSLTDKFTVAAANSQMRLIDTDDSTYCQFSYSSTALAIRINSTTADHFWLNSSGNVGIGTTSPVSRLHARQDQDGTTRAIIQNRNTSGTPISELTFITGGFDLSDNRYAYINSAGGSSTYLTFGTGNGATPTERMRITSGGEVYIAGTTDQGAYNLQCNGTGVWGAGAYVNGSDERIKQDITPIDTGLDVVNKLNPVTYKYKEDWSKDQSIQTGFIAQDLLVALEGKNYVDGIVQQGGEYMSVAYQNIIPLLTKAIQELSAKVTSLEAQLQGK